MAEVDFLHNAKDLEAAVLASMGFSTDFIQAKTGLSPGQIGYRLKRAGVKRAEYRSGNSALARMVLGQLHGKAKAVVTSEIPTEYRTAARKKAKGNKGGS